MLLLAVFMRVPNQTNFTSIKNFSRWVDLSLFFAWWGCIHIGSVKLKTWKPRYSSCTQNSRVLREWKVQSLHWRFYSVIIRLPPLPYTLHLPLPSPPPPPSPLEKGTHAPTLTQCVLFRESEMPKCIKKQWNEFEKSKLFNLEVWG